MKKRKAYSYTRFSSGKQDSGRSKARQDIEALLTQNFLKQHGLEVVDRINDPGVSAYSGGNTKTTAALGKFIELVKTGKIAKGSVLIVENLDRFSRSKITECTTKFLELINAGIGVGVVSLGLVLDENYINQNPGIFGIVQNEFVRARSESERKAIFTKDVIRAKLERAKAGEAVYFGGVAPSWIKGVKDGKWVFNTEKVLLVKRVFQMYLSGESCNNIARILNRENVKPLGAISDKSKMAWWQAGVRQLLSNTNVIGYCKVNDFEKQDYYPAIISASLYQKVQNRLKLNAKTRGGSQDHVPNIFRGLLVCGDCQGAIDIRTNFARGHDKPFNYAYCRNAMLGKCSCKSGVRMSSVELAVFSEFPRIEAKSAPYHPNIEALKNDIAKADVSIKRFTELLSDMDLTDLAPLKTKLKEAMAHKESLVSQMDQEKAKVAKVDEAPKAIGSLWQLWGDKDPADKAKVQAWVNNLISYLQNQDNRKTVRNITPDVFEKITLTHTVKDKTVTTDIACSFIFGGKYTVKLVKKGWDYWIERGE